MELHNKMVLQLLVWGQQGTQPLLRFGEHTAAVKAIAWSPHQHGVLASGGGTADRCIRFWNTSTNVHLNCIDTGSQVISKYICTLLFWRMILIDGGYSGLQPCLVQKRERAC